SFHPSVFLLRPTYPSMHTLKRAHPQILPPTPLLQRLLSSAQQPWSVTASLPQRRATYKIYIPGVKTCSWTESRGARRYFFFSPPLGVVVRPVRRNIIHSAATTADTPQRVCPTGGGKEKRRGQSSVPAASLESTMDFEQRMVHGRETAKTNTNAGSDIASISFPRCMPPPPRKKK
ncbi:unnamed protein product, partial [Ectocarpus fasciculatus]